MTVPPTSPMTRRQRWLAALLGVLAVGSFLGGSLLFVVTTFSGMEISDHMEATPSYTWHSEPPLVLETFADHPVTCRIQPRNGADREVTVPRGWWPFRGQVRVEPWFTGYASVGCARGETLWAWEGRQARLRGVVTSPTFVVGVSVLVLGPLVGIVALTRRSRQPTVPGPA